MTDKHTPNNSQIYAEDLMKYPIIHFPWEILRLAYHREGGGTITLTYIKEDFEPGYDLMLSHRVAGRGETWPYITCVKAEKYGVTLRMGFTEEQMQEVTIDESNIELEVPFETPAGEKGTITFELEGDIFEITEWDTWFDEEMTFEVDVHEYYQAFVEKNADVAYELALKIEDQTQDTVDIAMIYMQHAAEIGSKEAEEWIDDHTYDPEPGDGQWDPYV